MVERPRLSSTRAEIISVEIDGVPELWLYQLIKRLATGKTRWPPTQNSAQTQLVPLRVFPTVGTFACGASSWRQKTRSTWPETVRLKMSRAPRFGVTSGMRWSRTVVTGGLGISSLALTAATEMFSGWNLATTCPPLMVRGAAPQRCLSLLGSSRKGAFMLSDDERADRAASHARELAAAFRVHLHDAQFRDEALKAQRVAALASAVANHKRIYG